MRQPIKRGKLMAEINITPFTDVVLVLLIIFMITTPLLVQTGIKVRLPSAKSSEAETDKTLTITIDSRGEVFIGSKRVPLADVKNEIMLKVMNNPNQAIIVKGDKEVRYDVIIKVIDAAKEAGAKKFALAVESAAGSK